MASDPFKAIQQGLKAGKRISRRANRQYGRQVGRRATRTVKPVVRTRQRVRRQQAVRTATKGAKAVQKVQRTRKKVVHYDRKLKRQGLSAAQRKAVFELAHKLDKPLPFAEKHDQSKFEKRLLGIHVGTPSLKDVANAYKEAVLHASPLHGVAQLVEVPKPKAVEKELSGTGHLAKEGHKLAVKLAGESGTRQAGVGGAVGKVLGEAVDIAAQAPASVYLPAKAGVEAVKGDPQELKRLGKQIKEHDPLALTLQGKPGKAWKEAKAHPVATVLEASGVGSGASRGAGRVARAAPKGTAVRRIGSQERAPKVAPGTAVETRRRYSPGLVGKGAQVATEHVRTKASVRLYRKAKKAQDEGRDPKVVDAIRAKADRRNPIRISETGLGKRLNERVALAEGRRRIHRAVGEHQVVQALPKKHAGLALLLGRGIVKPSAESVRGYLTQVEHEVKSKTLGPAERQSAKTLARELRKALDDKKLDLTALADSGKEYAKVMQERQKGLIERKIISPEGARMAEMIPAAKQHVGITYQQGRALTPIGERLTVTSRQRAHATAEVRSAEQKLAKVSEAQRPAARADLAAAKALLERAKKAHVSAKKARQGRPVIASTRFVGPSGERVTAPMLAQRLRKAGIEPKELGFFSQQAEAAGPGAFFTSWHTPRQLSSARLTGEATRKGTFAANQDVGRASVARAQGLIDAHDEYAGLLTESALKQKDGGIFRGTKREVDQKLRDLQAQGRENPGQLSASTYGWRAVPMKPTFGKTGQMEELVSRAEKGGGPITAGIESALKGEGNPRGEWALVPESVADGLAQHVKVLDPTAGGKALRVANRVFRGAVLATSPTWLTGNVVEAGLRSMAAKAGPESYALGRAVLGELQKLDPALAEETLVRLGSGHFGMQEIQAIHTTAEMFNGSAFAPVARALGTLNRTHGAKEMAQVWNAYTHFVFTKNGLIEQQFKVAMLGRYAQDFLMDRNALTSWESAVRQAAKGLTNTNEQAAAAAWVRRAYGRYEAFGPTGRRMIQQYTPFVAWTLNAFQFLFNVLPRDHPALTGAVAMAYQASEDWRHAHGRGRGAKVPVPDFLQGSIPTKYGSIPFGRFTPAGAATDPLGTIGGAVLPQVSSAIMATKGLDWKGKPLAGRHYAGEVTSGEKGSGVLTALFGASVPGLGLATRIKKYGPVQGVNPFRPIKKTTKKKVRRKRAKVKPSGSDAGLYGGGGGLYGGGGSTPPSSGSDANLY